MKKVLRSLLCSALVLTMFGCAVSVTQNDNPGQEKIEEKQEQGFDYKTLVGNYQDEVSQRACMEVTENADGDSVHVKVSWSSSADESTTWEMNVKKDGDKFVYEDCKRSTNGTVESENQAGYFELKDGKLCWTGASEENCQTCQFVKM